MHPQEENPHIEKTKKYDFLTLHKMWKLDTITWLDCSSSLFVPTIYYWSDNIPINVSLENLKHAIRLINLFYFMALGKWIQT